MLEGKKARLLAEMARDMQEASAALLFEKAARLRDEIAALNNLSLRGEVDKDVQPEVFQIEPKKGMGGLRKILGLKEMPRTIEGVDIAHLGGGEMVASLVSFIDGLPFKPGYRRYRIKTVAGIDDFASIREVISRRFRDYGSRTDNEEHPFPDILLIDGGKGQLNAALQAFQLLARRAAVHAVAGEARGRDLSAGRSGAVAAQPACRGIAAACSMCAMKRTALPSITTIF